MSVRYEIQTRNETNKATVSRKLHIYCHTEWEINNRFTDAPLSDVSWSIVVMVVELACLISFVSSLLVIVF